MAIRNKADFYISVHCNKVPSTSVNGTMTFYHAHVPDSKTLADCIHPELLRAGKMSDGKVLSDFTIYESSGFGVLRHSQPVPGVLLELGFISNAGDRQKLINGSVQQALAKAVIKGLKVYLGNEKSSEKQESK